MNATHSNVRPRSRQGAKLLLLRLSAELHATHPGALLVPARLLRRLHKKRVGGLGLGLDHPHAKSARVDRDDLLRWVRKDELALGSGELPERVFLIATPPRRFLRHACETTLSRWVWRRLFHARVHEHWEARLQSEERRSADVWAEILALGQTQFDEIRSLLEHENLLLHPHDDIATYGEFVALALELAFFAPDTLTHYFPALVEDDRFLHAAFSQVAGSQILAETRLPSCPKEADGSLDPPPSYPPPPPPPTHGPRLAAKARSASRRGNDARAAIFFATAGQEAPARDALASLVARLTASSGPQDSSTSRWIEALWPLVVACVRRSRTSRFHVEARLLHDLQKACTIQEQPLLGLSVLTWVTSLGRRKLIRPVPHAQRVRASRLLRRALDRIATTTIGLSSQEALRDVLGEWVDRSTERTRETLRVSAQRALRRAHFEGTTHVERVASSKLIEELLDGVDARGFIGIGDLRDAVAANDLKLPDVSGPLRFLQGDRLLRLDRALARELEGVYRRGEVYMRFLQRLSSLAFGTALGRLLTLFVLLPFGGAFTLIEALQHSLGLLARHAWGTELHLVSFASVVGVGLLIAALMHLPWLRAAMMALFGHLGSGLRMLLVGAPRWLYAHPAVAWLRGRSWFQPALRFGFKPLLLTTLLWGCIPFDTGDLTAQAFTLIGSFLGANVLQNSYWGQRVEEWATDGLARVWRRVRFRVVPGLIEAITSLFKRAMEWVERGLYAVDERLRFRGGDSPVLFVLKLSLGFFWSVCTYFFRLYINLLVEPQVNPIKHFPVVTVSHKIILPMTGALIELFRAPFVPVFGELLGSTIAGATVVLLPGVFGFLVWEFKSNWKLYGANRSRHLTKERIGAHSETMGRFMKRGFHSGTLPKIYDKLRTPDIHLKKRKLRRLNQALRSVERDVRRFVDRRFLRLLQGTSLDLPLKVASVRLSSKRIGVEVSSGRHPGNALVIAFEDKSGWLVFGIAQPGWSHGLDATDSAVLTLALGGLHRWAGVDLLRAELDACAGGDAPYDIENGRCVTRTPVARDPQARSSTASGGQAAPPQASPVGPLLLSGRPLIYDEWVRAWATRCDA